MWAEPNRACIWIKQSLCYNEIQASFCVTIDPLSKVNIEKRSWSYTLSLSGVPSGKNTDEMELF